VSGSVLLDSNFIVALFQQDPGAQSALLAAERVFVPSVAQGRPIPDNDIWIAAIARQHSLSLITRDAHFREIEGLKPKTGGEGRCPAENPGREP
jgi:predicted nucleic acid-binding protein